MDSESLILLGQLVEILLQQDIFWVDVGEDQVDLRLVTGRSSTDDSTDNLQHGSNTSSASNHTEMADHIWSVDHSSLGPTDLDGLAHGKTGHILGDVTGRIGLDQEVDEARLVVA